MRITEEDITKMMQKPKEGETKQTSQEEPKELSSAEKLAMESGWRPKEEWQGSPDDWVDAKTFNERGELMDRIKSQTRQIKNQGKELESLKEALIQLGDHNKKIAEQEYQKAMTELKKAKAEAFEVGDYDAAVDIDEKISDLKTTDPSKKPDIINKQTDEEREQEARKAEAEDWVSENPWYINDPVLRGSLEAYVSELISQDPVLKTEPRKVLERAKTLVQKELPERFEELEDTSTRTTRGTHRQSVMEPTEGSPRAAAGKGKKFTQRHLNEEQRRIGNTFVRAGAMKSLDEYAAQLAEIGELDIQKGI